MNHRYSRGAQPCNMSQLDIIYDIISPYPETTKTTLFFVMFSIGYALDLYMIYR